VIILIPAVLFAGLAIYYAVGIVKDSRERRLDREARERRDEQAGPLEDSAEAAEYFASLRELNGSGRKS